MNITVSFSKQDQYIVESLASQAAVTITNRILINAQKELFDSFIKLVAKAIDEKSPYTGGHCRRVPVISLMLADAACEVNHGPLKEFRMNEDELYELELAAWLHDCGKITTPEAIVDKSSKLEGIHDGINLIATRFEIIKRDTVIHFLQEKMKQISGCIVDLEAESNLQKQLKEIINNLDFIKKCNIGSEFMQAEDLQRIAKLSELRLSGISGKEEPLLTKQEIQMLSIRHGNLSDKERSIINNHVSMTLKMLQSLPYPKNLKNIPELAASHHERMDGKGYPRGLTKDQLSLPARIIAIADIFEALTANDRPYKKAIPLTSALDIMERLKKEGHIDPDLFDVFMEKDIPQRYAELYLMEASSFKFGHVLMHTPSLNELAPHLKLGVTLYLSSII
ncbi:MAG: HD domain-containing protein [Legionella longbeachae]|nr:HD domain-containing protein [Legionella longbeachae]